MQKLPESLFYPFLPNGQNAECPKEIYLSQSTVFMLYEILLLFSFFNYKIRS